jgi:hypothetical protein
MIAHTLLIDWLGRLDLGFPATTGRLSYAVGDDAR